MVASGSEISFSAEARHTVLVVDNNEDNLPLLRAILESASFIVRTAPSVSESRKILLNPTASVDLVLSDISMPVETGFDLLEWMRHPENHQDHIPVLLITAALPEDENRIKGLSLGAVDYIVRPINNQELILRIRNALTHYKQFRALRDTLESSQDMAMTGRVLAAANHEIRNIVTLIRITGDQALAAAERGQDMKPGTTGHQALSSLSQMTALLTKISRDLNTHISAEQIRTTPCDVNALIDEVVNITRLKLRSVALEFTRGDASQYVLADPTRVKQILVNFFLNALDAINEKGLATQGRISIRVTEGAKDKIQIRVEDNGIGLIKQEVRTDFEAFKTTKAIRGGKGLGLWLCSRLACAMGGRIALESKGAGMGATAFIELKHSAAPVKDSFNISDYLID